eukprot:gene26369-17463_t
MYSDPGSPNTTTTAENLHFLDHLFIDEVHQFDEEMEASCHFTRNSSSFEEIMPRPSALFSSGDINNMRSPRHFECSTHPPLSSESLLDSILWPKWPHNNTPVEVLPKVCSELALGGPPNGDSNEDQGQDGKGSKKSTGGKPSKKASTNQAQAGGKQGSKPGASTQNWKYSGSGSSTFRGVTRHRHTGKWEAHLWDSSFIRAKSTKAGAKNGRSRGKQVYLGLDTYAEEIDDLRNLPREEVIAALRRGSSGFARGVSKYRGVTLHQSTNGQAQPSEPNKRWEARMGRVDGDKYLYLGAFPSEIEAAIAFDMAVLKHRGMRGVTNLPRPLYYDAAGNMLSFEDAANAAYTQGLAGEINQESDMVQQAADDHQAEGVHQAANGNQAGRMQQAGDGPQGQHQAASAHQQAFASPQSAGSLPRVGANQAVTAQQTGGDSKAVVARQPHTSKENLAVPAARGQKKGVNMGKRDGGEPSHRNSGLRNPSHARGSHHGRDTVNGLSPAAAGVASPSKDSKAANAGAGTAPNTKDSNTTVGKGQPYRYFPVPNSTPGGAKSNDAQMTEKDGRDSQGKSQQLGTSNAASLAVSLTQSLGRQQHSPSPLITTNHPNSVGNPSNCQITGAGSGIVIGNSSGLVSSEKLCVQQAVKPPHSFGPPSLVLDASAPSPRVTAQTTKGPQMRREQSGGEAGGDLVGGGTRMHGGVQAYPNLERSCASPPALFHGPGRFHEKRRWKVKMKEEEKKMQDRKMREKEEEEEEDKMM